jgi:hypothetical protein
MDQGGAHGEGDCAQRQLASDQIPPLPSRSPLRIHTLNATAGRRPCSGHFAGGLLLRRDVLTGGCDDVEIRGRALALAAGATQCDRDFYEETSR